MSPASSAEVPIGHTFLRQKETDELQLYTAG